MSRSNGITVTHSLLKQPKPKGVRGVFSRYISPILRRSPLFRWRLQKSTPLRLRRIPPNPGLGDARLGALLLDGHFVLCGERLELSEESWMPKGASKNWLRTLHGFEWLADIEASSDPDAGQAARHIVGSWIKSHRQWSELPWNTLVCANRILSWLTHFDLVNKGATASFTERFTHEVADQINYLVSNYANIKLYGQGRIRLLKALLYGSLCLPDGNTLAQNCLEELAGQLVVLLRADGGTQHRSVSAQIQILEDLIDIRDFLRVERLQRPQFLKDAIAKMQPLAMTFIMPDGHLAHVSGGMDASPERLERLFDNKPVEPLEFSAATGYNRIQARRAVLFVDAGVQAPTQYDKEAHASTLSFEFFYGTQKIIGNIGCHKQIGIWGQVQRATAAHSTLVLDNRNSSEIRSDGSIGRQPSKVFCRPSRSRDARHLDMSHDGYTALGGYVHYRRLHLDQSGQRLRGEDRLSGPTSAEAVLRFHLHPLVQVETLSTDDRVMLYPHRGRPWQFSVTNTNITIEDSVYMQDSESYASNQLVVPMPARSEGSEHKNTDQIVLWDMKQI